MGNLNAHDLSMMTDSNLVKAQGTQGVLAAFHRQQGFPCDWMTVGDTRREARGCRLVPDAKSGLLCQQADLSFGKTGLKQRGSDVVPFCRFLTGTKIALIVEVYAVGNAGKTLFACKLLHKVEELILAVKATEPVITNVFGELHLLSLDEPMRNLLLLREGDSILELNSSQTGRVGGHGQHIRAEHLVCHIRQVCGINAPGIGDESPTQV